MTDVHVVTDSELRPVRVVDKEWIPMSDGTRLAAKIWLPEDAERNPVPAVLEYIPYRKRDYKAVRDAQIHGFFAAHGYAGVRVDLRGSGDSEGVLRDEYLQQELDDGLEVLRWLNAQPWCTGDVGMFGLSWGGFNGLQIAALQPPQLKAIITVCSSDDRYADDVHYMGGCLLTDNLSWASTMFAYNSCPPDPQVVGEKWRDMWIERLEGSGLWLEKWLRHQTRDDYWKHASVCEGFSAIKCPVFAVSGWADGYSNTVFRLLENLDVPRKGLIGAWGHKYPHMGTPGPAIDFLGESVRWWDRWLKEIDNGVDEDPMLQVWRQDATSPLFVRCPGSWIAEQEWPAADISQETFLLTPGRIEADGQLQPIEPENIACLNPEPGMSRPSAEGEMSIQSPLSVGLFAGKWCSYAATTDLPNDQREEDGGALIFDTLPLERDVDILGGAVIDLDLSSNKPVAMVSARISDVAPSGTATRVTYGLLNLTHRNGHEEPEELEPGARYRVNVQLNHVAQRFPAGHRIRVSISSSYWPLAWPPPEDARLTIYAGTTSVTLPVREPKESDEHLRDLGEPQIAPSPPTTLLAPASREWTVVHNLATNEVTQDVENNDARYRLEDIDLEVSKDVSERFTYVNNNYDTLRGVTVGQRGLKRGDWEIMTVTRTVLTSTRTHFRVRAILDAYEGDTRVFSKSWDESIARVLV